MKINGFTIIELIIVIVVVAIVATLAAPRVSGIMMNAKITAAEKDLQTLREAIVDVEHGLLRDVGSSRKFEPQDLRLSDLLLYTNKFDIWSAERERGWHGPYVKANGEFPSVEEQRSAGLLWRGNEIYGIAGGHAVIDPWGMPYILQIPDDNRHPNATGRERFRFARLVSLGADRRLDTPFDRFTNLYNSVDTPVDDLVLYLVDPESPYLD